MKCREFLDYVADIQGAAQHIEQFIAGMTGPSSRTIRGPFTPS
jgi:hypothetical protein